MERRLLEYLKQHIKVEKFCGLGKECYEDMALKFGKLSVFLKMGYGDIKKISFWGGFQAWKKELFIFSKTPEKWVGKKHNIKEMKLKTRLEHTIFMYFLMAEYKVINEETSHKELFQRMAENFGLECDFSLFSRMEDFVLFLALRWKWNVEKFVQYLDEMQEIFQKDASEKFLSDLDFQYDGERRELTVKTLKELLERQRNPDSEETVRATRMSVFEANALSKKLEEDKDAKGPKEEGSNDGTLWEWMEGHGEYKPILRTILDTEQRRRWYLYRMISIIIEKQIKELASEYALTKQGMKRMLSRLTDRNLYNGGGNTEIEKEKEDGEEKTPFFALEGSGTKTSYTMPDSPIMFIRRMEKAEIPSIPAVVTPAVRRELLEACIVNTQGISYAVEMYFDVKDEHEDDAITGIFESCLNRCISWGLVPEDKKDEEYEKKRMELINRAEKFYEGESKILHLQASRELFWDILVGKSNVSRELLLLFILLARLYGAPLEKDYIEKHVLANSRFSPILNEENRFDAFFLEAWNDVSDGKSFLEKVDTIRFFANAMEKDYLRQGIAPFQSIAQGRRLG